MLGSIEGSLKARNQTLERMKQFVADASHELRTPLVSLRGYAELYRKGAFKSKAEVDDAIARIESEAVRMSSLVESLLALTRLDNETKLNLTKGDLAEVANSVINNIKVAKPKAKIALLDEAGVNLKAGITAKFDEAAIRQILTNLLNNAVSFAGEKPIEVIITKAEKEITVEVVDHGEGIPKQLRTKVFQRFYRSDNSRFRDTGGSGLGLAIVKGLVEGHGGKIVSDETKGGGATFRFTIPN
jgi:two-component system OmpR family sensor kinase